MGDALLIGIDIGTSGAKALAATTSGEIVARATREYPLYHPKPGWAEQDPEDWWTATTEVLQDVAAKLGDRARDVKSIALSGQMHGSVFLDENGKVIRPAILWCDGRTTEQCRFITESVGGRDKLIAAVSNPAMEGFTAPKIVWLMQNEPENYERTRWVLLPKDYIRYRLTGELLTEMSDAAGTILLDVRNRRWSETVLRALNIPEEILPEIRESTDPCGVLRQDVAEATGLPPGIVVGGGGADNTCGAVGAGIVVNGRALSSIGTSGVVVAQTGEPRTDPGGRVHTFNHSIPHTWYVMGVSLSAGLSLRWFRDKLGQLEQSLGQLTGEDAYDILAEEAAAAPAGSEGLIFLPYLSGERTPHADAAAKGVFFGLTPRHGKGHMVRAVMEGVVYALRDSLEIIRGDMGIDIKQVRAIGGGAKSPLWRQMQADIMGVEVATLNIDEGPAFGAAILGGVAAGVFDGVPEAAEAMVKVEDVLQPDKKRQQVYEEHYRVFRGLYPALRSSFAEVHRLTTGGK